MESVSKYVFVAGLLMVITFVSGCSLQGNDIMTVTNNIQGSNGTIVDASRTFELVKFCTGASFDSRVSISDLNCSIGNITDTFYNNATGNWSCMSCSFDATKCSVDGSVANITLYSGLNLTASHIISADYDTGAFTVMCCNNMGTMCYRPYLSGNGTYEACGAGYNELVASVTFNNVSNDWSVTSCLNGFK